MFLKTAKKIRNKDNFENIKASKIKNKFVKCKQLKRKEQYELHLNEKKLFFHLSFY